MLLNDAHFFSLPQYVIRCRGARVFFFILSAVAAECVKRTNRTLITIMRAEPANGRAINLKFLSLSLSLSIERVYTVHSSYTVRGGGGGGESDTKTRREFS